jgi:fatty acid desaturase
MAAVATGCGPTARWRGAVELGVKLPGTSATTGAAPALRRVVAASGTSLWVLALIVAASVAVILGGLWTTGVITFGPSVALARE